MADRVGQQFGNYRFIRLLGRGGFAEVYLGEHVHLKTHAAIKVLHTPMAGDNVEGFLKEAQTVARLKHPHIVRVFDFAVEEQTPFLVMDYFPLGNVRQYYPKGIPLPLMTIVSYVSQIADAVQYAHNKHLIHRDIKPENMLLAERDEIVLSDFGLATVIQSSGSQSLQGNAGTAAYMAPEQLKGRPVRSSDQYALGIVVYEWLCGARPFTGTYWELAYQHASQPPPSLQEQVPAISPDVEQVVVKALAKDPQQRFMSVRTFADELERTCTKPVRGAILGSYRHHAGAVYALAWSPEGSRIASSSIDRAVRVWQAETGNTIFTYRGHTQGVWAIKWSPDGSRIASGSAERTVHVWGTEIGQEVVIYRGHTRDISAIAWSPDGSRITSGSLDETVRVWDAIRGHEVLTHLGHAGRVEAVAWSPNGFHIASGSWDKTVQVWQAEMGFRVVTYHGHTGPVYALAWSPDGSRIASGSDDKTVQVWDATTGRKVLTYRGHTGSVRDIAWSPDGSCIASGSDDKTVQVWDATTGGNVFPYRDHFGPVYAVAWSPESTRIVSAGREGTMQVWQAR